MPIKTAQQRKAKLKDIALASLVSKVKRFSINVDETEKKDIIKIDIAEKKISISNPNYEALSFAKKKDIFKLKNEYSFYIQWEFFII